MVKLKDLSTGVVWPDLHAPRHHIPSVNACLDYLRFLRKRNKPDFFVSLGDWCDFDSLSRFQVINSKDIISLHEEIASANQVLDQLDGILPKHCVKIMTMGNHDKRPELYRLNNWDAKDTKTLGKIMGFERIPNAEALYKLKERGWDWVDHGELIKIGKCLFTHGYFTNKWHTEKTLMKFFKSIVYGHCHNFQVANVNGMDGLPVAAMCIGTLSRFDLSYMRGVPPGWVNMFMTMDFFKDGTFTPHPIPIINGRFIKDGRIFGKK